MPTVANGIQMLAQYLGAGGATATNVVGLFNFGDAPSESDLTDFATGWETVVKTYLSNQWAIQGGTLFRFLSEDPVEEIEAANGGDSGDTAGSVLPAQCSICVSLRAQGGRRGQGRIYLPGVSEGSVDDTSHIDVEVAANIQTAVGVWISEVLVPADCTLAVYSRLDQVMRPIQALGVDTVIDTQRRRVERLSG